MSNNQARASVAVPIDDVKGDATVEIEKRVSNDPAGAQFVPNPELEKRCVVLASRSQEGRADV